MTLPVTVGSGHHHQTPGGIDPHSGRFVQTGPCAQLPNQVRRCDAARLDVAVHTKAAQLALGLRILAPSLEPGDIRNLFELVHRRGIIAGIVFHRHRCGIGEFGDEILTPQLDGVHFQLMRGFVDQPLQLIGRLGAACAAVGINRHRVGEHGFDVHIDQGRLVIARHQRAMQPCRHRRCKGRQIRAHVGIGVGAQRGKVVVRIQRQFDLGHVVPAMRIRNKRLGPA